MSSLSQSDFRRILENKKQGKKYGGKRELTEDDLRVVADFAKEEQKLKRKKQKKNNAESDPQQALPKETKGKEKNSKYRDRVAERKKGINPDYDDELNKFDTTGVDVEHSKFLGGDLAHTHLVKGLDFALLSQLKRVEKTPSTEHPPAPTIPTPENQPKKPQPVAIGSTAARGYKSRQARQISLLLNSNLDLSQDLGSQVRSHNDFFHPGRTWYRFKLNSDRYEDLPTIIQRGKKNIQRDNDSVEEEEQDTVSGFVELGLIQKIQNCMEDNHERTKSGKLKRRRKVAKNTENGRRDDEANVNNEESLGGGIVPLPVEEDIFPDAKSLAEEEEDIFPDAGEYVPPQKGESVHERFLSNRDNPSKINYFENLSAATNEANERERQKDIEKELEWKDAVMKVIKQTGNAKDRNCESDVDGQKKDDYAECYPEYEGAGADSDDDAISTKKKVKEGVSASSSSLDNKQPSKSKGSEKLTRKEKRKHKVSGQSKD